MNIALVPTASVGALLVLTLIGGCATPSTTRIQVDPEAAAQEEALQQRIYVRTQQAGQKRVQELAYPMLVGATDICDKRVRAGLGFSFGNVHTYPKQYQDAAQEVLGLDRDRLTIFSVIPGAAADRGGVKEGDLLVQIGGKSIPSGKRAAKSAAQQLQKQSVIGEQLGIRVLRDGEALDLSLSPDLVCDSYVVLIGGDEVNAYADGKSIYITTGMLRFAASDNELATVIGHELAHNAMGHRDKKTTNFLIGSIFDVIAAAYGVNTQGAFGNAGAMAFSQDFEAEADYVGLYILAAGGYEIEASPDLWRRMGALSPGAIVSQYGASHPGTAERYLALDQIVGEVKAKQASGMPLLPDSKNKDEE